MSYVYMSMFNSYKIWDEMEIFIAMDKIPWTPEKVNSQNLQYINKCFISQNYMQCMNKYHSNKTKVITLK